MILMMRIETFVHSLNYESLDKAVFNPWYTVDVDNDIDQTCCRVRRQQLSAYLSERINKGGTMLVGEALGYQGGHFTGIAMTSERILLGRLIKKGIHPHHVFSKLAPQRTSRPAIRALGFSEPTATIVWGHLIQLGIDTRKIVLWNAFPWHPYNPAKGMLSNRTPTDQEMTKGIAILRQLIQLTGVVRIVAVGQKSKKVLQLAGIEAVTIRHPAHGGASKFRSQFQKLIRS